MNERTFLASNAHRLDDPARLTWMPPREVVSALELKAGMMIADIGCGTGYFAIPFAREVAPDGHVFAVDMQPGMLEILGNKSWIEGAPSNISLHAGEAISTGLAANSCDLVFLGNIWHELDHALAVLNEARRILHPGGRVAILDWRTDVPNPPGPPPEHRISVSDAKATMASGDWKHISEFLVGTYSYLLVARSMIDEG